MMNFKPQTILSQPIIRQLPTIGLAGLVAITTILGAGQKALGSDDQNIRWTPAGDRGQVGNTRSGGRRGQEMAACSTAPDTTNLTLLVPDEATGLRTTSAQPTFAWHTQTQAMTQMEFILTDPGQATPIYSKTFEVDQSGIIHVTLPENIALEMDTRYRWTVLSDCASGTQQEIFARSFIERFDGEPLEEQLGNQSYISQAMIYAGQGFWYNALAELLIGYEQSPNNGEIEQALTSLLAQGMGEETEAQLFTLMPAGQ